MLNTSRTCIDPETLFLNFSSVLAGIAAGLLTEFISGRFEVLVSI